MPDRFSLDNVAAYNKWRDEKLANYPARVEELIIPVEDPQKLTALELTSLRRTCAKTNFAIYHCKRALDKSGVKALGHQLGLIRLDHNICADTTGISSLQAKSDRAQSEYIPYSNKLLNWHTDGYYNSRQYQIHSFILHCARPAASGGQTSLLDQEIIYILLRDENPEYIRAFMHPGAMTIPANTQGREVVRGKATGPVFSTSSDGELYLRYTSRTQSILWRDDEILGEARRALRKIIDENRFTFKHTLESNQGVVCNNALHARMAFTDSPGQSRLIFRALIL